MSTERAESPKQKIIASIAVLVVVTIIVLGIKVFSPKNTTSGAMAMNASSTGDTSSSSGTTTTSSNQTYKDGTYTATGSYDSPSGNESIQVRVTIQSNVVTATTATDEANDPTAQEFQDDFIQGYKTFVVGKNVNSIELSNVSGSSLTPQGFNDALAQIKHQAAV